MTLGIKSPSGKGKWCKRAIDVMLSNEKYTGNVRLLDNGKHDAYYLSEENNPAIISKEAFQAVQIEKQNRSNVTKAEDGSKRKSKKYSSKK
ncbi:recombinase family protein [Desulfosporosinus shakirovi]|uniref:recombinase family protein n=1 Tax=Desulfosporosinus shakirovi TaxID=2885154 RepID=UPI001E55B966|nr:recombinase family protein [Desulfosporosinus sp. SRJS8]MCB8817563.1 recombinase family protein [Desulfosporosinus sp. SRJS8]